MIDWLKEKGIMYIQNIIYVFQFEIIKFILVVNNRKNNKGGINPFKGVRYPFDSPILWAIISRSNGKSSVYKKKHTNI